MGKAVLGWWPAGGSHHLLLSPVFGDIWGLLISPHPRRVHQPEGLCLGSSMPVSNQSMLINWILSLSGNESWPMIPLTEKPGALPSLKSLMIRSIFCRAAKKREPLLAARNSGGHLGFACLGETTPPPLGVRFTGAPACPASPQLGG